MRHDTDTAGSSTGQNGEASEWEILLSQHKGLLEEHLKLWEGVRERSDPGTSNRTTAEKCWTDTQAMMDNFSHLKMSFDTGANTPTRAKRGLASQDDEATSDEAAQADGGKAKKRKRTEPPTHEGAEQQSGAESLFMIDTNPTSVDHLIQETTTSEPHRGRIEKRKLQHSEVHVIGMDKPVASKTQTVVSKKLKKSSSNGKLRQGEDDEVVMAQISKRQAEKDAKKQAKRERKRKRESTPTLEDHAQADVMPFKKKRQKGQPGNNREEEREQDLGSENQTQAQQTSNPVSRPILKPKPKIKPKPKAKPKHLNKGSRKEKSKGGAMKRNKMA